MKKQKKLICIIGLGIILGIGCFFAIQYFFGVYTELIVEAGSTVEAPMFVKKGNMQAYFKEEPKIDMTKPGRYEVKIHSGIFTFKSTLVVKDTIAPIVELKEVSAYYGEKVTPEQFIESIEEATAYTVSFKQKPDLEMFKPQQVSIIVKDAGENVTEKTTVLQVIPCKEEETIEAGDEFPTIETFLLTEEEAEWVTDVSTLDLNTVERYELQVKIGENVFVTYLNVTDTQKPHITWKNVESYQGVDVDAQAFAEGVMDNTKVTFSYEETPDFSELGEHQVEIIAKDEGDNEVRNQVTLTILEDTEPPVIKGAQDTIVFIGDAFSYRQGIAVVDNSGVEIPLQIQADSVRLDTEGTYEVEYSATDYAGNTTSQTIQLTVKKREYSLEQVNELADKVLEKILTEDMTSYEKVQKIYYWVRQNIGYISHSDKEDYVKAAYEGFTKHQGDCYVYFAVSKVLLTQAGIDNRDIEKIPKKTSHYWNLVNIGDGWYHFDTTPRHSGGEFLMLTNDQLMAYSERHYGSHAYDKDLYADVEWGTKEYHDFDPTYVKPQKTQTEDTEATGMTEEPAAEQAQDTTVKTPVQ